VDVVFPVLHGTFGEDGAVQGLLDLATSLRRLRRPGLRCWHGQGCAEAIVPAGQTARGRFLAIPRVEWEKSRGKVLREIRKKFRFPVFVKPATLGSSVGMTKRTTPRNSQPQWISPANSRKNHGGEINSRPRNRTFRLGNEDPKASIPGEIIPHREFYDYAAKYLEEGTRLLIPAKLTKTQVKKFQEYAVPRLPHTRFVGYGRVDFFLEHRTGKILLNEVNTIPGFTSISMYPKLWEASGLPYRNCWIASLSSPSRSTTNAAHEIHD